MNPTNDCFIKLGDAICGKEDDTLAVFKLAKKHRDEAVSDSVSRLATLEEYICLIQKKDCFPMTSDFEDVKKLCFKLSCRGI